MRYAFVPLVLGLGANALVARNPSQCYQLQASGPVNGVLGQLDDGQNRVGGGHPTGCYCLDNSGGFTDSNGRGCILTPPTTQFQCDVGAHPTDGFAIGPNKVVTHSGSSTFSACSVNDHGEYNVYSKPVSGQKKCVNINLSTGKSCGAGGGNNGNNNNNNGNGNKGNGNNGNGNSNGQTSCPLDLKDQFQAPHLIVPVSHEHPDKKYGNQFFGTVGDNICTIFNFDIPNSYNGKKCSANFLWPKLNELQTSSFNTSGSGEFTLSKLTGPANDATTWNNRPAKEHTSPSFGAAPGGSWTAETITCPAGQTIAYEMCVSSGDLYLRYFQDTNPSPIGLYVRAC